MNRLVIPSFFLLGLILLNFAHADVQVVDVKSPIEALMKSVIDRTQPGLDLYPKKWTQEKVGKIIDLEEITNTKFEGGTAFGAVESKIIDRPYPAIKAKLSETGGIFEFMSKIKTLRDLEKISEALTDLDVKIAIKVPVLPDFHTEIEVKDYEDILGRGILEWKQVGHAGDVDYLQGAVILEGDGPKTKLFVIGIHILKPEKKIGWLLRGSAKTFTKDHYGNFISAVESLLGIIEPVNSQY